MFTVKTMLGEVKNNNMAHVIAKHGLQRLNSLNLIANPPGWLKEIIVGECN